MRFQAAHKLGSYLLAIAAVGTLASSGEVSLPTGAAFLTLMGASWFFEPETRLFRWLDRTTWLVRAAIFAFFAFSVWEFANTLVTEGVPGLSPVLNLVLFLLCFKFFQRRANRDYLQIFVLSFLAVLAAAALAQSIFFSIGFAIYVVLATWTLILFHLRREMEENYLVKHSLEAPSEKVEVDRILNSRRVVGRPFFAATAGVALAVFAGSTAVFFVVPRVGVGFFFGEGRRGRNMAGFDDQVALGQHGVVSTDNQTVALRATVPFISNLASDSKRDEAIAGLYWRGTVYDTYFLGQWTRSQSHVVKTKLRPDPVREPGVVLGERYRYHVTEPLAEPRKFVERLAGAERHEIDVVGLSHPVAFALDQPVAFETAPRSPGSATMLDFEARWSGEVALRVRRAFRHPGQASDSREFSGARYVAYSRDPLASPVPGSHLALDDVKPEYIEPYLAVPESLAPRIRELALTITADKPTASAKMLAIIEWLQKTHTYTLNLQRNPAIADPLEDFLFHQTAGHCEYFASAAAVLLRLSGVPSRYVNGFLGGQWNGTGKHITVRDSRAHSWVEAYLGELGWARMDATPSGVGMPPMSRLRQFFDYTELLWSRWVIEYDLSRQVDIVRRFGNRMGLRNKNAAQQRWSLPSKKTVGKVVASMALLYAAAQIAGRLLRRRRAGPAFAPAAVDAQPIARLYRKALERLARRGLPRGASETPHEFSKRVSEADVLGIDAMERLTDLYTAARFGRRQIDADVVADLGRRIVHLGKPMSPPEPP